jgi:hypothetical protein
MQKKNYYKKYNFPSNIDNMLRKPQWKNSDLLCRIHTASYTTPHINAVCNIMKIFVTPFLFLPCNW